MYFVCYVSMYICFSACFITKSFNGQQYAVLHILQFQMLITLLCFTWLIFPVHFYFLTVNLAHFDLF